MPLVLALFVLFGVDAGWGQAPFPDMGAPAGMSDDANLLKFNSAPVDMVLEAYAEKTGRTLLMAPSLPSANITLRSQGALTREEYLEAILAVLSMNGISILHEGEKFARVVPSKQAREEAIPILLGVGGAEDGPRPVDTAALVSQMIAFKHIEVAEAMKALQPLQRSTATANAFEGINSVLITDTAANINRILEVVAMIDQPIEAREEPIIVQIQHAKASEIKSKLEQIIAEASPDAKRSTVQRQNMSGAPGVDVGDLPAGIPTPPGIIRARRSPAETPQDVIAEVERGLIRGQVKIIDDDRTNILILITRRENMTFFEKIIQVLDVQTDPDVTVKVFRLEYAEAKDIASMLNDLIGATSKDQPAGPASPTAPPGDATALRDYVPPAAPAAAPVATAAGGPERASKVGELSSDSVKILSDERTNALIIMASKSDLAALTAIIKDMDLMLSQVLVEAVIVEISLNDSMQSGVDWVQRTMLAYDEGGTLKPKVAFGGGGGGGTTAPLNPLSLTTAESFAGRTGSGLSYYMTLFDLNIDMVFRAVATDSRTRILSSPVIMTQDNKDATIEVTQDQYFFKGQVPVSVGTSVEYVQDVERQSVGIKLAVTPRINENGFVVMEIEQSVEDVTGQQRIGDTDWPIVTSRKINADVSVRSGDTIVLGGLVKNTDKKSRSGIPFLADIPVLGVPFRSSSKGKERQEVLVFITPYVLDTPEEAMRDGARRYDSTNAGDMWERGWSDSKLSLPRRLDDLKEGESLGEQMEDGDPAVEGGPPTEPDGRQTRQPAATAPRPFLARESSLLEPAPPAEVPAEVLDPMQSLDPELRRYVEDEDRRWRRTLRRVDRATDREVAP